MNPDFTVTGWTILDKRFKHLQHQLPDFKKSRNPNRCLRRLLWVLNDIMHRRLQEGHETLSVTVDVSITQTWFKLEKLGIRYSAS